MALLVKALGYYSHKGGKAAGGISKLKSHLKYLEHGKAHPNEPAGFNHERDEVSRAEFLARVDEQPQRGVIAHKLVFSISQDERDRLGIDMRQLVRSVMDDWGRKLGRPINWVGFEHQDQGHPHVHVVVGGFAGEKQVGLYQKDLISLREFGAREIGRQVGLERALPTGWREPDMVREVLGIAHELARLLDGPRRRHERERSGPDWER